MKKMIAVLFTFLLLFSVASITYAYIPGDIDNDFVVTSSDARFALRMAVGLEKVDADSDQFFAADADGDGAVTSSDARTILRVAVGLESFPDNTSSYGNITVTKLPYTTNGLVINSISFDDSGSMVLQITNRTGKTDKAVSASSYIPYKIYNKAGNVIYSGDIFVKQMNPGESCTVSIYQRDGMTKLVFGAATVSFMDPISVIETTVINGFTVSKPPFTVNGITVNAIDISAEDRRITLDVTNQTGVPVSGSIYFQCKDDNGNSKGEISVYTLKLAAGEKSREHTTFPVGTTTILYSKIYASEKDAFSLISKDQTTINGITVTKTPITKDGFTYTVEDISDPGSYSSYYRVRMRIKNGSSNAIGSKSYMPMNIYDADGYVTDNTSVYFYDLNPGESCIKEFSVKKTTAKILFGEPDIKIDKIYEPGATQVIDGLEISKMPYKLNGLTLSDLELTRNEYSGSVKLEYKITNSSGRALSNARYFVKIFDSARVVMNSGYDSAGVALNPGDYCYGSITVSGNTAKILFFDYELTDGEVFSESKSYSKIDVLRVTSLPYKQNGLSVVSGQVKDAKYNDDGTIRTGDLVLTIKNETGKTVSGYSSYLRYKIYGTKGEVLKTATLSCRDMNAGESCEVTVYLPSGAEKIILGEMVVSAK